jgi:hypothetical protein
VAVGGSQGCLSLQTIKYEKPHQNNNDKCNAFSWADVHEILRQNPQNKKHGEHIVIPA